MGRFLTLRGGEDGRRVAEIFAAWGQGIALLPLQRIVPLPAALPPPWGFAGVLATSAHAAPWLASQRSLLRLPALAVGSRTAQALSGAGFSDVRAGRGEAGALVPLAREIVNTEGRAILYAAGRVRRPETEALFAQARLPLHLIEVYDTHLRQPEPGEIEALRDGEPLAGVLLLSVRQALCFAGFFRDLGPLRLLCLSDRIRAALPPELRRQAETAALPTLDALAERAAGGQEARRSP